MNSNPLKKSAKSSPTKSYEPKTFVTIKVTFSLILIFSREFFCNFFNGFEISSIKFCVFHTYIDFLKLNLLDLFCTFYKL
jgi:hypothetical protein